MDGIKDLIRPPFANYDIVVYFGVGPFSIPFFNRYVLEPGGLNLPKVNIDAGSAIANEVISLLALVFTVYILGHIIAYVASQFIEKLTDRLIGKISTAILVSSWASNRTRNEWIRAVIFDRLKSIRQERAIFPTTVRLLFHIPVLPLYGIVYIFGIFGYYNTRVPYSVINAARKKIATIGIGDMPLAVRTKWFKPIEYYVINNCAAATSRMYNYLVIGGLFRSLSLVFLLSLWAQVYYYIHFRYDGDWLLRSFMGGRGVRSLAAEYLTLGTAYTFCLFSYLKFQRRYAEEAIFAFVFAPSGQHTGTATI